MKIRYFCSIAIIGLLFYCTAADAKNAPYTLTLVTDGMESARLAELFNAINAHVKGLPVRVRVTLSSTAISSASQSILNGISEKTGADGVVWASRDGSRMHYWSTKQGKMRKLRVGGDPGRWTSMCEAMATLVVSLLLPQVTQTAEVAAVTEKKRATKKINKKRRPTPKSKTTNATGDKDSENEMSAPEAEKKELPQTEPVIQPKVSPVNSHPVIAPLLSLGAGAGLSLPVSQLNPGFYGAIEPMIYLQGIFSQVLIGGKFSYSRLSATGSGEHLVFENGYHFENILDVLKWGINLEYQFLPFPSRLIPFVNFGPMMQIVLTSQQIDVEDAPNKETSVSMGVNASGGIMSLLGPGGLFAQVSFNTAKLDQTLTGDTRLANFVFWAGYRFIVTIKKQSHGKRP